MPYFSQNVHQFGSAKLTKYDKFKKIQIFLSNSYCCGENIFFHGNKDILIDFSFPILDYVSEISNTHYN